MTLNLVDSKDVGKINEHPGTWNYVVTRPEMTNPKSVYEVLNQLEKSYGRVVDSVGVFRRHFDKSIGGDRMFSIVVDRTKEEFSYSHKDKVKYFPE
jgi:hypothetical protein